MSTIGFRIKSLRKKRNLSQKDFANRIFISQSYLSRIELDKESPTDTLLKLIALEFECSFVWLRDDSGDMEIDYENGFDYFDRGSGEEFRIIAIRECSELLQYLSDEKKHIASYYPVQYFIKLINYCTYIKNENRSSMVLNNLASFNCHYFDALLELEDNNNSDEDIDRITVMLEGDVKYAIDELNELYKSKNR